MLAVISILGNILHRFTEKWECLGMRLTVVLYRNKIMATVMIKGSYLADSASSHGDIVVNSFEISGNSRHYLAGLGSPSGTHKFGLLACMAVCATICLYRDCVS